MAAPLIKTIIAGLVFLAFGCSDPYADKTSRPQVPGEQPADRVESPPPESTPKRSPHAVAREAAELATNWSGETAPAAYRRLAALMTGDARREADEAAARISTDPQLRRTRSAGSVQAITTTRARDIIVVTRETVSAQGLRDSRYRVTLARAVRARGGWLLSRWDPQP